MSNEKIPRPAGGTQPWSPPRPTHALGFDDVSSRIAAGTQERPVALLLGETSDPRTRSLLATLEHPGPARDVVEGSFQLVFEDRRARPDVWELLAPKLEALTGRFGVPWVGFLGPCGETWFGAVGVSVEAQADLPGLVQLLTFARDLHRADPEKARASGIPWDARPAPEEDAIPLPAGADDAERARVLAGWLRSRQDLAALAFPGRTAPGLPAMLTWVRHWERFRDRGLDVRLQRLLDAFGRFLGPEPPNPWSALWTLFQAARIVATASDAEGLDPARARADVTERLATWGAGGDPLDEALREATRSLLEGDAESARRRVAWVRSWARGLDSAVDWDHPSAVALRLEEAPPGSEEAEELRSRARERLPALGLAGLSLAAALLRTP